MFHSISAARLTTAALAAIATLAATAPVRAQTVLIDGYATSGADLAGAQVTASFLNGTTELLTWGAEPSMGVEAGGVFSEGWSLTQQGNSFWKPWTLTVSPQLTLQSLMIDLVGSNSVFDVIEDSMASTNTQGSKQGAPFRLGKNANSALLPTVNYSAPVDISNGDLFTQLTLNWESGLSNTSLDFVIDTDSGTESNPVTVVEMPVETPAEDQGEAPQNQTLLAGLNLDTMQNPEPETAAVPEPGSALGLLAIAALGRRFVAKRRANA